MTDFRINPHLRKKAEQNGVALSAIWHVLLNPETTFASYERDRAMGNRVARICRRCGEQQQKWQGTTPNGDKFCVVVNPCCGEAVTYWQDQAETALRADQKAAGVTGYRGRDGKWRS